MKRKELKAKLISTLGEHDGLEVYKKMKNQFQPRSGSGPHTWKQYVDSREGVYLVMQGFAVWNETAEGHTYWSNIRKKFND